MAIADSSTLNKMGPLPTRPGVLGKYLVHPMIHDSNKVRAYSKLPLKKRATAKHKAVLPQGKPLGPAPALGHLGSLGKGRVGAMNKTRAPSVRVEPPKQETPRVTYMRFPKQPEQTSAPPMTVMSSLPLATIPWMRAPEENLYFKPVALSS
mmetsp:Transcript_14554/g.40338  ORF Transcript_14554/g.40338 Transcript_14554/m.40338 type:complete len:151 (+) Transcript_14554:198-650(+)|eukprot:CAMPEP_0168717556 /NCGR_PEP_ID=MMETSP0724-20121128/61_1 /TAXON_ID=265536 /ORGANISM="Amphiprora sp., Strain CCMP467" /LENGTH=150 /DNA_ID=CAMNT_0008764037 /DNA_START=138 /DNA_END=590 /DNA_ORIENTATION=-